MTKVQFENRVIVVGLLEMSEEHILQAATLSWETFGCIVFCMFDAEAGCVLQWIPHKNINLLRRRFFIPFDFLSVGKRLAIIVSLWKVIRSWKTLQRINYV